MVTIKEALDATPVQVTAPQRMLSDLKGWVKFLRRKGIKTRISKDDNDKDRTYILWRELTPDEKLDLARGKLELSKHNMLVYAKRNLTASSSSDGGRHRGR